MNQLKQYGNYDTLFNTNPQPRNAKAGEACAMGMTWFRAFDVRVKIIIVLARKKAD